MNSKWLTGGGEVAKIVENTDWSKSPLGPIDNWPQSLKTALSICLSSKFPMGIWWGPEFVVFYNDAYIPIAGKLKHPMYIGRPAVEMWPEIWSVVGQLASDVLKDGIATWQEDQPLYMVRPNGLPEERYFTFSFSPARDELGEVGGMFYAVQEMTSRVIGERRLGLLRELGSEEAKTVDEVASSTISALSKSPHDVPFAMIYLTSDDFQTASLAGACGVESDTSIAPNSIDLTSSKKITWPFARICKIKKPDLVEGLRAEFENVLPVVPYEEKPDSAYIMPIEFAGQPTPGGFLVLGINPRLDFNESYKDFFSLVASRITNQVLNVRSLAEEKKRSEELAEIDRAKTAFFSNVSHEFRTPLTLMLGPIESMLSGSKGDLTPQLRLETEVVHRNALRLLKLVNTLLDFSRIEAGRAQATYVATDLAQVTKNFASSFRSAIEQAGLKFTVKIELLSGPVLVDLDMWEKIVLNLLSNAFKYTLEGEIEVNLKNAGKSVELSVRDTGVGIPENELEKVFERFHRVEGTVGRTYEGTGIGLALVQELIKLHDGSIRLQSQLGKGSTFTVTIPFGTAQIQKGRIPLSTEDQSSTATRSDAFTEEALRWLPTSISAEKIVSEPSLVTEKLSKRRLLIADDNADMRDYIKGLLSGEYDVTAVGDGAQALASMLEARPDLVISDVMMPVMGGIELLKELRSRDELRTVPVILLSARAGDEAKSSGIEMGADDYLTKPFSAKELLARVRTQLYMSEVRKTAAEKDAELAHFAQQQHWLEQVLDLLPTPLLLMEPEAGRMKFANQAAHKMAGGQFPMNVPAEQVEAKYGLMGPDGKLLPSHESPAARAIRGEKVSGAEVIWRTPAGQFSLLVDTEKVPGTVGQSPMIILCLSDVTRMKEIESELRRLIGARDEFLSIASHELKTPLTSLKLQVQMIQRKVSKGDPNALAPSVMSEVIDLTDRQVVRLTQLVDDMLDVSRMESGNLGLNREKIDLAELVFDVVARLHTQARVAGTEIILKDVASTTGSWDRLRIEQVLINLLTNAFRYGNGKAVEVQLRATKDSAQIVVRDFGNGISADDTSRIFKRFERANAQNQVSGLGLGLYISRQIVEAHGGTLEVISEIGKGSSFTIDLPLIEEHSLTPDSKETGINLVTLR